MSDIMSFPLDKIPESLLFDARERTIGDPSAEARDRRVEIVFSREEVKRVLLIARTGRSSRDLFKFLSLKRDEMARLSLGQSPSRPI